MAVIPHYLLTGDFFFSFLSTHTVALSHISLRYVPLAYPPTSYTICDEGN